VLFLHLSKNSTKTQQLLTNSGLISCYIALRSNVFVQFQKHSNLYTLIHSIASPSR